MSFGEEQSDRAGSDEGAWAQNRRDEFEITAGGAAEHDRHMMTLPSDLRTALDASAARGGSRARLSTTACMASKGDVRVLQDELRALRSSIAQADTRGARRLIRR